MIIAYFAVFISAMVIWVIYASRQKMELVGADYYEREVLFQREIDASARGRAIAGAKVEYDLQQHSIAIEVPAPHRSALSSGSIHLYRPNNARLDRDLPLTLGADGSQKVDAGSMAPGLWKVRVTWRVGGEDYLFDQPIIVGAKS
jgi:nitrogen fixation protein FixH